MKILLLHIIGLCLFLSCKSNDKKNHSTEPEYIDFADVNGFDITDNSLYIKLIPLETTDESVFGQIYDLKIVDSCIYIVDFNKVLIFDISGKFIKQLSQRGGGPGEYLHPLKIHIDKNKNLISLADCGLRKMFYYNLDDHKFISDEEIPYFSDCVWLSDGHIIWHHHPGYDNGKRKTYYLKVTDPQLLEINMICPAVFVSHLTIGGYNNFHLTEDGVYFHQQQFPEIYKVTAETSTIDKIISFGEHSLPPSEWFKDISAGNKDYSGALNSSNYINYYNIYETDNYIMTSYVIYSLKKAYIGFYDKIKKTTCKYLLWDFQKQTGLYGMSNNLHGVYDNYFITSIFVSSLKNKDIINPDLKSIADKSSEDDNNIICLFKPK